MKNIIKSLNSFMAQFKIATKVLAMILSSLVFIIGLITVINYYNLKAESVADIVMVERVVATVAEPQIAQSIKNVVNVSMSPIMKAWDKIVKKDNIIYYEKEKYKSSLKDIRYGNEDYVFIFSPDYIMQSHPLSPALEGKNQKDLQSVDKIYVLQEIVKQCEENRNQEAFVYYQWQKPNGKIGKKVTYGKYYPDLKWYVCTGVYLDEVQKLVNEQKNIITEEMAVKIHHEIKLMLIVAIVALLLFGFLSWVSVKLVLSPLRIFNNRAEYLSQGEGDLTLRLKENSTTELGLLGRSFNKFIMMVKNIVIKIKEQSILLATNAQELLESSHMLADIATKMTNNSEKVATQAENVSNNMTEVATATEQMNSNITQVAVSAEEMSTTANEIAKNAGNAMQVSAKAVKSSEEAMNRVGNLSTSVNEIKSIVDLISDISSQTNLLALNATIEAARAGEAGKGFAVVANEIKDLAGKTAQATKEIKEKIGGIEVATDSTINDIQDITQKIGAINEEINGISSSAEEQSSVVDNVAKNMAEAQQVVHSVAENIKKSAKSVHEVAQHVVSIKEDAKFVHSTSQSLETKSLGLQEIVTALKENINGFFTGFDPNEVKQAHITLIERVKTDKSKNIGIIKVSDYQACNFGQWFYNHKDAHRLAKKFPELWEKVESLHKQVHQSLPVYINGKKEEMFKIENQLRPEFFKLLDLLAEKSSQNN